MIAGALKRAVANYIGRIRKPAVLQMPITSRCNSRCKTCNVWKHKENVDIDFAALSKVLKDDYFSNVTTVGLNGGEFTLVPNFLNILDAVLTLPRIKYIYLITNGLSPARLFEYLKQAKARCDERGVLLNICLSVDGVGKVHEAVRGIPNCFAKTEEILQELCCNSIAYCHSFTVGCTLSRHNIPFVKETESFFGRFAGLHVEYHLAVPNRRIHTQDDYHDYYAVNDDRSRLLAAEFFYTKYLKAKNERYRRQCFVNYYFLKNKGRGRLCTCEYRYRDVTIDENLNMALCATASNVIGNLKEQSASAIIRSRRAKIERRRIIKEQCGGCVHYSYHDLTLKGRWLYIMDGLRNAFVLRYYAVLANDSLIARWYGIARLGARVLLAFIKRIYTLILMWR